jgi:hypothetical protein
MDLELKFVSVGYLKMVVPVVQVGLILMYNRADFNVIGLCMDIFVCMYFYCCFSFAF